MGCNEFSFSSTNDKFKIYLCTSHPVFDWNHLRRHILAFLLRQKRRSLLYCNPLCSHRLEWIVLNVSNKKNINLFNPRRTEKITQTLVIFWCNTYEYLNVVPRLVKAEGIIPRPCYSKSGAFTAVPRNRAEEWTLQLNYSSLKVHNVWAEFDSHSI